MKYESYAKNLDFRTELDFKIFSGYITLSFAFVAWYSQAPLPQASFLYKLAFTLFALAISVSAVVFLYLNYRQRKWHVLKVIKNIGEIFKFGKEKVYSEGPLHPPKHKTIFWFQCFYIPVIVFIFLIQCVFIWFVKQ